MNASARLIGSRTRGTPHRSLGLLSHRSRVPGHPCPKDARIHARKKDDANSASFFKVTLAPSTTARSAASSLGTRPVGDPRSGGVPHATPLRPPPATRNVEEILRRRRSDRPASMRVNPAAQTGNFQCSGNGSSRWPYFLCCSLFVRLAVASISYADLFVPHRSASPPPASCRHPPGGGAKRASMPARNSSTE